MKVGYTEQAVANLKSIGDYVSAHNPHAATRIQTAIESAVDNLTVFPRMGRRLTVEDVRRVAVGRFPYIIYYRVDVSGDEIVVLMIRHVAQDRPFTEA